MRMIQQYPTLRIRRLDGKFECELTDPESMQIVRICRKKAKFTTAFRSILKTYNNLKILADSDEPADERKFSNQLNKLSAETGKILNDIFKDVSFDTTKQKNLALALDNETVKIPWEFAFVPRSKKPGDHLMLSDVLGVGRLRVVEADWWYDPPDRRRTNRALIVGTNYTETKRKTRPLDDAEEEAYKIADILESEKFKKENIRCLIGKEATKKAVLDELKKGTDIFHFTGHGSTYRNCSKIYLNDKDLTSKEFERKKLSAPRLTFFNACESSVETPKKDRASGVPYSWAYAMAEQGCRVFIGTFWTVCEPYAGSFAERFYEDFFGYKRTTLSEAIQAARDETILKEKKSDSTWPAYVLYGIPTMVKSEILR